MELAIEATRSAAAVVERHRARFSLSETLYRLGGGRARMLSDFELVSLSVCRDVAQSRKYTRRLAFGTLLCGNSHLARNAHIFLRR